jgi:predicted nucleotidyltransferase
MLEMASNFILGNKNQESANPLLKSIAKAPTSISPQQTLETGVQYSDKDLITIAESLPASTLNTLKNLSFDKYEQVIKQQIPNISKESIKRSREILEAML